MEIKKLFDRNKEKEGAAALMVEFMAVYAKTTKQRTAALMLELDPSVVCHVLKKDRHIPPHALLKMAEYMNEDKRAQEKTVAESAQANETLAG